MAQEYFLDQPMPDVLAQWTHYAGLLTIPAGGRLLDVGCGSGDPLRLLARLYPGAGEFVGLDKQLNRYGENHQRAQTEDGRIRFETGNALALPFADKSFDRVVCADVLEWIGDPRLALGEIRRVLRPGGLALLVHSDFDAQVFAARDWERNRQIVHAFCDAGPNGRLGRQLPGLCRAGGFAAVASSVYVLVNSEYRPNLYGYQMAQMMVEWLKKHGQILSADLAGWLDDLQEQDTNGGFFYSINRNLCCCTK